MTIGAGFVCCDGAIVAADTQETITGFMKGQTQKIQTIVTREWQASVTGAGFSDYVQMAVEQLFFSKSEAGDHPADQSSHQIVEYIENRALEVFARYFAPLSVYPEQERPNAELVITIQAMHGSITIVRWNAGAITKHHDYAFAGNGSLLASNLARRLMPFSAAKLTMRQMSGLAVYLLKEVKSSIDGCGGNTDLVLLSSKGGFYHIPTAQIRAIEDHCEELEQVTTEMLKNKIISSSPEIAASLFESLP